LIKVALTGGIGSGKTEVERLLAERGAAVVDSDVLARAVVEPGTPGLAAVLAAFGPGVRARDGSLDRAALAAVVFADRGELSRLEAIVHPLVAERVAALEAAAESSGVEVLVHSTPLLADRADAVGYDLVVVVDAPDEVRLERLVRLRGMAEADARARMAAQPGREQRLAVADAVIPNGGSVAELAEQVDALWAELSARARGSSRTS
jgi:dephospho-CoA kinase